MNFLDKHITITGGKGFLGKHLVSELKRKGYRHIAVADLPEYNLVRSADVKRMYRETKPDAVIHLAAKVGGIGFNRENPASLFYENTMMGVQLLHEGYVRGIDKFVALGTICAYPKFAKVPFREDEIWDGYPEETNAPYGLAKKMMLVQSQAYRQQYGFNSIFLLPVNLYGPGDNFNFESSHVVPALIRKFYLADLLSRQDYQGILRDLALFGNGPETGSRRGRAKSTAAVDAEWISTHLASFGVRLSSLRGRPSQSAEGGGVTVEIWGTGKATREFFYVEDAARAITLAFEKYDKSDPVNIGAGFEISIKELVKLVGELMEFQGKVTFNATKPDGQPRRRLDTTRAEKEFGFKARTGFRQGLEKTIAWYRKAH
ncbi:MAG TPA: GDP-L-fucose synthase [Syntrophorhabdaceae bacterium]|nr:GDP-L-fucose synthase [Syntrophorhabdaceae bacterium]